MSSHIVSFGLSGARTLIDNLFKKTTTQQLLDPMSTIVRLAIASFYNPGTKISINDNTINLQEPGLLQAPIRWVKGDKRTDLHNLYAPIEKALEWFAPETNKNIAFIFEKAKDGLRGLKQAYNETGNSNLVSHTITYYITMIDNRLKDKKEKLDISEELSDSVYHENTGISQLQSLWNTNDLKVVYLLLFQTAEAKSKGKSFDSYLQSILSLLEGKDNAVREIILRRTTVL